MVFPPIFPVDSGARLVDTGFAPRSVVLLLMKGEEIERSVLDRGQVDQSHLSYAYEYFLQREGVFYLILIWRDYFFSAQEPNFAKSILKLLPCQYRHFSYAINPCQGFYQSADNEKSTGEDL